MARRFPLAAIVGAVAGIVAGVLTAPKSGKETRGDIKQKAEELKGKAGTEISKAKTSANDALGDVKKKIQK